MRQRVGDKRRRTNENREGGKKQKGEKVRHHYSLVLRKTHLLHIRNLVDEKKKKEEEAEREAEISAEKEFAGTNPENSSVIVKQENPGPEMDKKTALRTELDNCGTKLVEKQAQIDDLRNERINLNMRICNLKTKGGRHAISDEGTLPSRLPPESISEIFPLRFIPYFRKFFLFAPSLAFSSALLPPNTPFRSDKLSRLHRLPKKERRDRTKNGWRVESVGEQCTAVPGRTDKEETRTCQCQGPGRGFEDGRGKEST
jgi:hypothetical protein